jgi:CheY-like chemotaxis protein
MDSWSAHLLLPSDQTSVESRRTVAIIDDDDGVRDSLQFLLETVGHPVVTFSSAAEFLKAASSNPACLILDHHMPEMTGLELAERLRRDGVQIPILLVTGSPSPAIAARAAELASTGCLRNLPKNTMCSTSSTPHNLERVWLIVGGAWSKSAAMSRGVGACACSHRTALVAPRQRGCLASLAFGRGPWRGASIFMG